MKTALAILALLFLAATAAHGQVMPEATAGTAELNYSVRYAQNAESFGGSLGNSQNALLSGNLQYTNGIRHFPFALTYGGGYGWNLSGAAYGDGLFENFLLSQGITGHDWGIEASDNVSYRKMAPITGFSGVAGTGEPVGGTGSSPTSSQTILTLNTRTIDNVVNGEFQHTLNYAMTLSVGGSSELLRYPDGNGMDTDAQMADTMLTRRLNARNSISGQYSFSDYSYTGNNLALPISSLATSTVLLGYQRKWNRRITTNVSVGPEWVESSNSTVVPSSTRVSGNGDIADQFRFGSASLNYSHATSGGGGFLSGAEVDSATVGFSREFEKRFTAGLDGGYMRTSSLGSEGEINSKFGAVNASLQLSPSFFAFASYTAIDQSSSYSLPGNVLTHLEQEFSIGIGYTPRGKHRDAQ